MKKNSFINVASNKSTIRFFSNSVHFNFHCIILIKIGQTNWLRAPSKKAQLALWSPHCIYLYVPHTTIPFTTHHSIQTNCAVMSAVKASRFHRKSSSSVKQHYSLQLPGSVPQPALYKKSIPRGESFFLLLIVFFPSSPLLYGSSSVYMLATLCIMENSQLPKIAKRVSAVIWMKGVPYRLGYLNIWFPVGGTVREGLSDTVLMKEIHH